jgi:hypothetical protein
VTWASIASSGRAIHHVEEKPMTATNQGPEFLDRRLALYSGRRRMVLGANTFRQFEELMGPRTGQLEELDPPRQDPGGRRGTERSRRFPTR